MKIELHLHTSRYSGCAVHSPEEMMHRLVATGYGAVYITEHSAFWTEKELDELRRQFPTLKIFSGVELALESQHLLVLGATDRKYLETNDETEILRQARKDGHLTVLAHPFRWKGGAEMLSRGHLPDALECRSGNQDIHGAKLTQAAAHERNLPTVNAGDSHAIEYLDRYWIETTRPVIEANDIRTIILNGEYESIVK